MSDAHPHDHETPEVALARHVDAICRRFEADWRAGRIPAISDYLNEIAEEGHGILRRALGARERAAPGRRGGDRRTGELTYDSDSGHGQTIGPRGCHGVAPR